MQDEPSESAEADVAVIGGGPAGSTAATLLARQGLRVMLFEKELFPRYQLGESLMVSTVHGICPLLGIQEAVATAGFVRKPGGIFGWGASDALWALPFTQAGHLAKTGVNYAYHVERSRFDSILLDHARRSGVAVRQGWRVESIERRDGRVSGVVAHREGRTIACACNFVVDASGASSGSIGPKVHSRFFRNVGISGYFRGASRLDPPLEGGGISEAIDEGWLWFLPLSPELTSVGVVLDAHASKLGESTEALLNGAVARSRHVRDLVANGSRIREGIYGQTRIRSDYSYLRDCFARDGIFLCGDAAAFLDPLFTTGVHLATYSALLAARSILSICDGMDERLCIAEFEHRYRLEFELFHNYVLALYDMHARGGEFWQLRKIATSLDRANQPFVDCLTQGQDEAGAYFDSKLGIGARAQEFVRRVEAEPDFEKRAAISREMALDLHFSFQPPSGPRPFHVGFEELRTLVWDRDSDARRYVSPSGMVATDDGMRWQRAA